jgi:hypothetical protein
MSPLIFIWLPYDIYINKDNIIDRIELVFLKIYSHEPRFKVRSQFINK